MEKGWDASDTSYLARGEAPPSDNLYVSDLPSETNDENLRKIFGPGVTQCKVLPNKTPGSPAVALVRFGSVEEAKIVRETLNGAIPPGQVKPVSIRFCGKPDGKGGFCSKGSSSGKYRSDPYAVASAPSWNQEASMSPSACGSSHVAEDKEAPPSDNLYITGLPPGMDNDTLKAIFSQYGVVVQCKVMDPRPDATATHALVRYSTVDESVAVKKALSGYIMQGLSEPIIVHYAIKKDKGFEKGDKGGKGPLTPVPWEGKGPVWDEPTLAAWEGKGPAWDELTPVPWEGKGPVQGELMPGPWEGKGPVRDELMPGLWEAKGSVREELTPVPWEGKGWKGDGWKGDGWKGETCWKGGPSLQAWKGDKGKGGDTSTYKGNSAGKGMFFSVVNLLQGFAEAKCLPGQDMMNDDNALYVSGLPKDCDDVHLYRLMAPFGAIPPAGLRAMKYPDGTCKGFGFVNYIEPSAMAAAMQMLNGTLLPDGTVMHVTPKQSKNEETKQSRVSAFLAQLSPENGQDQPS